MSISDSEFLKQFEEQSLCSSHFDHWGHLRIAWLYLNKYPLALAIDKTTCGISIYAASLGATDKFQHTLTEAIVRIMAKRIECAQFENLEGFLAANQDLLVDIWGVVGRHYSEARLNSDLAKSQFVSPDLLPID